MMDHDNSFSLFIRALIFAVMVLLYLLHPLLGWAAMAVAGYFAIVRFVRRSSKGQATAGQLVR